MKEHYNCCKVKNLQIMVKLQNFSPQDFLDTWFFSGRNSVVLTGSIA